MDRLPKLTDQKGLICSSSHLLRDFRQLRLPLNRTHTMPSRLRSRPQARKRWLTLALLCGGLLLPGPRVLADGEHPGVGEHSGVEVQTLVRSGSSWNGTPLPADPSGEPEITVLRIAIPPGMQLPLHIHPVINAGMLIRGQLLVISEAGPMKRLKTGDGLIEMVNQPHFGRNNGKEPAEIVVV